MRLFLAAPIIGSITAYVVVFAAPYREHDLRIKRLGQMI